MDSSRSKNAVATTKQIGKKFYNSAVSVGTAFKSDDFFNTWIPILIILIATIGLVVSEFANCTFHFTHFLFGLRPHERILG